MLTRDQEALEAALGSAERSQHVRRTPAVALEQLGSEDIPQSLQRRADSDRREARVLLQGVQHRAGVQHVTLHVVECSHVALE